MKTVPYIFLVTVLFGIAYAATSTEHTDNTVPHEGHCYSTKEGVGAMEIGECKRIPGRCANVWCTENTDLVYHSCDKIELRPGCTISSPDLGKPYLQCCPKQVCP